MQFTFHTTTTREALLELPGKAKRHRLQCMVDRALAYSISTASSEGKTSYLWELEESDLNPVPLFGAPPPRITMSDVVDAVRARYPGCSVEFGRCHKSTSLCGLLRILRSGIRIDWS